ncbi:hypothetical protein IFM89_033999 [Coptis chinensis]|uniref:Uncharacterized protein n=1 Tax=Coptis chinensis TaxID=261450 RepID=A0A835MD77_9MAGN|nr:hypothetical protein IFM89_033999 [Coptis chinensis]
MQMANPRNSSRISFLQTDLCHLFSQQVAFPLNFYAYLKHNAHFVRWNICFAEEQERSIEDIATIRIQTVFPGYKCVVVDWWCALCELVVCGLFVCSVWCCTGQSFSITTPGSSSDALSNVTYDCTFNASTIFHVTNMSLLGNFISGTIPREIGSIATLEELRISDLNVSSMDFHDLQELTKLEELVLRSCSITGPIPSYIGERMLNIKKL